MLLKREESIQSNFQGTVIDLETIGEIGHGYPYHDSRNCSKMRPIVFGAIDSEHLTQIYAKSIQDIPLLIEATERILASLQRPYYAFNCSFESSVWFHTTGKCVSFDGELQKARYQKKAEAVATLRLSQYNDPFFDNGRLCEPAWMKGNIKDVLKHNRACLLKERDILIKQSGSRTPEPTEYIPA